MAVLLDDEGREMFSLSAVCDGSPCISVAVQDPISNAFVLRFVAQRPGALRLRVNNVRLPLCKYVIQRQMLLPGQPWDDVTAGKRINDITLLRNVGEYDIYR